MGCNTLPNSAYELVAHSIFRKYSERSIFELAKLAEEQDNLFHSLSSNLGKRSRLLDEESRDIARQIEALSEIENTLVLQRPKRGIVSVVHSLAIGKVGEVADYRTTNFIPDFGGLTLTDFQDVPEKIYALEGLLCDPLSTISASLDELSYFLAEVFCSIIEIHPYSDANGRTARLLVQVFVRRRGRNFLIIPKYRNSAEWRECLNLGLSGNLHPMQSFFRNRI